MNKRPLSVTVIGLLLVAAGAVGLAYHLSALRNPGAFQYDIVWVSLVRLIAVVGGVFMLRGSDWARWLALAWIAYHIILSGFHSRSELVAHSLLGIAFGYFLLGQRATRYFRAAGVAANERIGRE